MPIKTLSTFTYGDTTARFLLDEERGCVGLELFPSAMRDQLVVRRQTLLELPEDVLPGIPNERAWYIEPLAHVKIVGDWYGGAFSQGHTMRSELSDAAFRFASQRVEANGSQTIVITTLRSENGCRIEHRLAWHEGEAAAQVQTTFFNDSSRPVTLEMLTSFALGGLTPFHRADAPERLRVHRFRSVWSAEGRLETRTLEELHLERSWSGAGAYSERFGQVGSMPVRGWFPFVAVEDVEAGVVWGAQLAWAGSWQMEIFRQHDPVCISGGLADREFGHWMKTLASGESLVAPPATLACVQGGLDEVCDRLTQAQQRAADTHPAVEADLPIVFNEWCTTWGDPSHERVVGIARRLSGSPVKYLVIDAGWYQGKVGFWGNAHGDWVPSSRLFPHGLKATADAIKEQGLIPGLWFEMETVGQNALVFALADHLLARDGIPVSVRERRFWNLNDTFAVDYLAERVIGLLKECGFGYLKVDYNETIGLGCEGESLGEGLRLQIEGVYRLFERIRRELPDLVIENCSSGGHRLEPSMLARTAMSSFSDAHEVVEIPLIAANLHHLMLPRQSQIWAVLKAADSNQRLIYSLAATFLGRMCLSGAIDQLTAEQWQLALDAQELYGRAASIIKLGKSRLYREIGPSWRHPRGWQAVVRVPNAQNSALVVLHTFAQTPAHLEVPLPPGNWRLDAHLGASIPTLKNGALNCDFESDFSAQVALLTRENAAPNS
ncbi:alpha-galactosidase AgaA [Abditibacteriota bacterium]|nr:alpha-galactosidase AgaA [Abditibacteriota bacterium]